MAKGRQKPVLPSPSKTIKGKGRGTPAKRKKDEIEEYGDMLREARREAPQAFAPGERPPKRPKTDGADSSSVEPLSARRDAKRSRAEVIDLDEVDDVEKEVFPRKRQRKRRDPTPEPEAIESDDDESEEENWEEVDLAQQNGETGTAAGSLSDGGAQVDMDIVLDDPARGRRNLAPKKRGITAEDRKLRLVVHKIHLLCLLTHVYVRSTWSDNPAVKAALQPLLTKDMKRLLHPDRKHPQPRQMKEFQDGVKLAKNTWQVRWKLTARGLSKPAWVVDPEELQSWRPPEDTDGTIDLEEFFAAAKSLSGSRDLGAQLLCAFFRAAGVSTRLACSLQPLPWKFKDSKSKAPTKPAPEEILHSEDERTIEDPSDDEALDITKYDDPPTGNAPVSVPSIPDPRQRASKLPTSLEDEALSGISTPMPPKPRPRKRAVIAESLYPVYWVEVFSIPAQSWIPVDALVTETMAKRLAFEPPASDPQNEMSYVVAFEADGQCRDVTRRYAKLYNAKTLKSRIEATEGGLWFWKKALSRFRRGHKLDRDQIEDMELARWEAQEPMPNSVADFKDHPQYALERHLKRGEALHPREPCGKVPIGKPGKDGKRVLEPVYRRKHVQVVKSAETWFRSGRVLKEGAEPLKVLRPVKLSRRQQEKLPEGEEGTHGQPTALFAQFQTELYRSPPVVQGRVPRNAYGNIDVYVPSMVPPGGVHVIAPDVVNAAKMLGFDYAEAVVGFEFRGRSGFPILKGVVVAEEHQAALYQAIEAIQLDRRDEEIEARTAKALQMWKKFVVALKVRERVAGFEIEGEKKEAEARAEVEEGSHSETEAGGGFVRNDAIAEDEGAGGFLPDADEGGGFVAESANEDEDGSGGFVLEPEDGYVGSLPDADAYKETEREPSPDTMAPLDGTTDQPVANPLPASSRPPPPLLKSTSLFESNILTTFLAHSLSRQPSTLASVPPLTNGHHEPEGSSDLSSVSSDDFEEQAQLLAALEASRAEAQAKAESVDSGGKGGGDERLDGGSAVEVKKVERGPEEGEEESDVGERSSRASHDPEDDLMDADWAI